jgi:tetratricopeptide (TPR) repeat protein
MITANSLVEHTFAKKSCVTRSHSFFYFRPERRRRLLLLAFFGLCLALAPGCSRSHNEAADKAYAQALDAVRQFRYADAEVLFNTALPLYAQADNPDKFNEATAALADLEYKRGKLSKAFLHYHAARFYFEQKNDAPRITLISNALADLYALTGSRDSAAMFASAALRSSRSSGNAAGMASSELEMGRIALIFRDPASAVDHFAKAADHASAAASAPISLDVALNYATALAALNRNDEALRQLESAGRFAAALNDSARTVRLRAASGSIYLRLGMLDDAMEAFRLGLTANAAAQLPGMDEQLLCGIGEVFFATYAQAQANDSFSKAYGRALAEQNAAAMGYCLMRMGACAEREALHAPSASSVLRAVSLFQQASALFRNDASPQRLALALLKEASLRSALHEDADAEPLFQQAFDLMRSASTQFFCFNESFVITDESRLLPAGSTCDDWWYRPYASFLVRKRRIGDALAVMAEGRASSLRRRLSGYPIAFQDTLKNSTLAQYLAHVREASIAESELMARQALPKQMADEPDGDSLSARYQPMHRALSDEGSAIASRYPSLLPLVTTGRAASFESIVERIPAEGTLVSYMGLDGKLYAVIVPAHANALAVELGPEPALRGRIGQYCAMVQKNNILSALGQKTDDSALRQASMQIASLLFAPIESHCSHRIVIDATDEIGALPVHALLLPSGRCIDEMFDITYAPFINTPAMHTNESRLKNVVAFGAPSTGSLESEYELRSIKNFYPDAAIIVTLLATEKNFRDAAGDVLHFSTFYGQDALTGRSAFALSGGSITAPENYQPASSFLMARPFRFWIIADLRRDSCLTAPDEAMFALMSGASRCVLQRYSCAASTAKEFNELFYTSLLANGDGKRAYREALLQMQKAHPAAAAFSSAPYFLMEW